MPEKPSPDSEHNRASLAPENPSTIDFARAKLTASVDLPQISIEANEPLMISGYRVTAEIARGGMGRVFAAHDLILDREVAIKTLLRGADPARFVTEARITAKLPHPGIPPVHALGELEDGAPFLAMKLVRGHTLADLLQARTTPLEDLPRFMQIFEQIAQAVGFAHARAVVHRDLKPSNVMVGEFGEVQVMDWGLAKNLSINESTAPRPTTSVHDSADCTSPGIAMGTPGYMSPEQARGEPTDARADVFALGSILATILTSRPAFVGETARDTIALTARAELGDVRQRLEQCAADPELRLQAIRYLAAQVADRPSQASEVASDIAAYRARVSERLRQAETERAKALVREAEQQKRRRGVLIAAGTIIVLLVAGLIVIDQFRRRESAARAAAQSAEAQQRKQFAQSSFEAGSLALDRGNWQGALPLLNAAAEAGYEDRVAILLKQATAQARLGNLLEVERILQGLDGRDLGPHQGRYLVLRAEDDFIGSSNSGQGLKRMSEALASGTLKPAEQAYVEGMLATTFPTAIEKLKSAIQLDPYQIEARMMLTTLFMMSGQFSEAERQLNALSLIAPQDPGNHTARAMLQALQGDLPAAKRTLEGMQPNLSADEIADIYAAFELADSVFSDLDQTKEIQQFLPKLVVVGMKLPAFAKLLAKLNPRVRHWAIRAPNHPAMEELYKRMTGVLARVALFQRADEAFLQVAEIDPDAFFLLNGVNLRFANMDINAELAKGPAQGQAALDELRNLEKILLRAQQCSSISRNVQRLVLHQLINFQAMIGTPRNNIPVDDARRKAAAQNIRQFLQQYHDLREHEVATLAMASFLIRDGALTRFLNEQWVAISKGNLDSLMFQMQFEASFGDPLHSMALARSILKKDPKNKMALEVLEHAKVRAEVLLKEFSTAP